MKLSHVAEARITLINNMPLRVDGQCVVYWMQKDQRAKDNWALIHAVEVANELRLPLVVVFFVWEGMRHAYVRHFDFMLRGLAQVAKDLDSQGIGFVMRHSSPVAGIVSFTKEVNAACVVTDQSYLQLGKSRRQLAASKLDVPLEAVDASLIVPPTELSEKQLWAAFVARPKLSDLLDEYLTEFPFSRPMQRWQSTLQGSGVPEPTKILAQLDLDASVQPVRLQPGSQAAATLLALFESQGVSKYKDERNDPVRSSTSQMSAYLHFGQISAQRIALTLKYSKAYADDRDSIEAYLDELITWRELSSNFVKYNSGYDSLDGIPDWAKRSLEKHQNDPREFIYSLDDFEQAVTHDELWNAAQMEVVKTGRMHGYMRMYWAKKILEWTKSAQVAIEIATYLNDKYELDGREPGGYAGILWAIGGLHDRPWFEREIYGQIRYMNANGAKKKFDVTAYIAVVQQL
jgi:deoxyribodipyrimidine photo-lyase